MLRTGYRGHKLPQNQFKLAIFGLFFRFVVFFRTIGRLTYKTFFLFAKLIVVIYLVGKFLKFNFAKAGKFFCKKLKSHFPLSKLFAGHFSFKKLPQKLKTLTRSKPVFILKSKFIIASLAISALLLLSFSFYFLVFKDLPNPKNLVTKDQVLATKIYDRNGQLLYTIYNGSQKRSLVKLEDVPPYLIDATIAVEDNEFWQHPGFSLKGIFRAFQRNLVNNSRQGGSTITQQLIKNSLLTSERTLSRKLKEIVLAIQVELIFSKKEILQMYFNEIPYGGTAYGVAEAAWNYFGKSVNQLSLAEAALLAGLPAAPTKYSPFGANPQLAYYRQNQVLQRMVEEGYIGLKTASLARKEKIHFNSPEENIKAPHFVMYVKDLLVEKYGTKRVEQGGLEVITSLDLQIQQQAEQLLNQELAKASKFHITNGAVLITKPNTGEILAMVGSKDYFDVKNEGNVNITTALRQPGSSIKPINYAVALQNGFTPASIINDSPVVYYSPGSPPYAPVNYDQKFHGQISLRTALASSYNIPAVKILSKIGINKMIDLGEKMGITTWKDRSRFGLSLTLGAGEVKMVDMAVVYGSLANQGLKVNLSPILQVKDFNNRILQKFNCQPNFNWLPEAEASENKTHCNATQVISPLIAFQLTDILSDNNARAPAFGTNSLLNIPNQQVAVKTGTTNDKRDNWAIGYTKDYVVIVWVGNNDNSPMNQVASGLTGASPVWNHIFTKLLNINQAHTFPKPPGIKAVAICQTNGLLPCQGCPTKIEYFIPGTEPVNHCNLKTSLEQE